MGFRKKPALPSTAGLGLESLRALKFDELAASRYKAETSGVTVNGIRIRTDRESQALITGAALQAVTDAEYACHWKTENGFVELAADSILAAASAVRAHVQACFDREAELDRRVAAAQTREELLAIVW